MDPEVTTVVGLVNFENEQDSERWFTAMTEVMSEESPPSDLDQFLLSFAAAVQSDFDSSYVDEFTQRAAEHNVTIDMITKTAGHTPAELVDERNRITAESQATGGVDEAPEPSLDAEGRWWEWDAAKQEWVHEIKLFDGDPTEYQFNALRTQYVPVNPWLLNPADQKWYRYDYDNYEWVEHIESNSDQGEQGTAEPTSDDGPELEGDASAETAHEILVEEILAPIMEELVDEFGPLSDEDRTAVAEALKTRLEESVGAGVGGQG
jgi:hypothetical protein